uniref:Uncharacterized protein n=1 Tax=Heterorhabditis bacteriophora TaxID=37862 RepID=A0A1I7W8P5_HETBA
MMTRKRLPYFNIFFLKNITKTLLFSSRVQALTW